MSLNQCCLSLPAIDNDQDKSRGGGVLLGGRTSDVSRRGFTWDNDGDYDDDAAKVCQVTLTQAMGLGRLKLRIWRWPRRSQCQHLKCRTKLHWRKYELIMQQMHLIRTLWDILKLSIFLRAPETPSYGDEYPCRANSRRTLEKATGKGDPWQVASAESCCQTQPATMPKTQLGRDQDLGGEGEGRLRRWPGESLSGNPAPIHRPLKPRQTQLFLRKAKANFWLNCRQKR